MNYADIRMIQGRCGARLAPKAFERLSILCDAVGQKLQRDEATEVGVLAFVDDAHSAPTEFLQDAVMGNSLTDHLRRFVSADMLGAERG